MSQVDAKPAADKSCNSCVSMLFAGDCSTAIELYKEVFDVADLSVYKILEEKYVQHFGFKVSGLEIIGGDDVDLIKSGSKPPSAMVYLYVDDVDVAFKTVLAAGFAPVSGGGHFSEMEGPVDMFWGDRTASVQDPFGHIWVLAKRHSLCGTEEMKANEKRWAAKWKACRLRELMVTRTSTSADPRKALTWCWNVSDAGGGDACLLGERALAPSE